MNYPVESSVYVSSGFKAVDIVAYVPRRGRGGGRGGNGLGLPRPPLSKRGGTGRDERCLACRNRSPQPIRFEPHSQPGDRPFAGVSNRHAGKHTNRRYRGRRLGGESFPDINQHPFSLPDAGAYEDEHAYEYRGGVFLYFNALSDQ